MKLEYLAEEGSPGSVSPPVLPATATPPLPALDLRLGAKKFVRETKEGEREGEGGREGDCRKKLVLFTKTFALSGRGLQKGKEEKRRQKFRCGWEGRRRHERGGIV